MGFLDRFQGSKVDPMAEVSATAVAHLREQNLKFQKFMRDKVQELEEKVAMGQQRLSEADTGMTDVYDFSDYVPDSDGQSAGEVRISLEDSVPLTEIAGPEDGQAPSRMAEADSEPENIPKPEPVETPPEPEPQPVEEQAPPPGWENLFGLGGAADEVAVESEEAESEGPEPVFEAEKPVPEIAGPEPGSNTIGPESEAEKPAPAVVEPGSDGAEPESNGVEMESEVIELVEPAEYSRAAEGEEVTGQTGGSLLWDWRSLSAQNADDGSEQTSAGMLDPIWEPEAAGFSDEVALAEDKAGQAAAGFVEGSTTVDGTVDEEILGEEAQLPAGNETENVQSIDSDDIQALPGAAVDADEDVQEPDEEFILLGDAQEQEDMVDIPLPDELGEFS